MSGGPTEPSSVPSGIVFFHQDSKKDKNPQSGHAAKQERVIDENLLCPSGQNRAPDDRKGSSMKKGCLVKIVVAITAIFMFVFLLIILLQFQFPPSHWSKHYYKASWMEFEKEGYRVSRRGRGDDYVHNFKFSISIYGSDENSYSGGAPFSVAISPRSNSNNCREWEVASVTVKKMDGTVINIDDADESGHYSVFHAQLIKESPVAYQLGSWVSEYVLDLNSSDTKIWVYMDVVYVDELNERHTAHVEEEFESIIQSGWLKFRN